VGLLAKADWGKLQIHIEIRRFLSQQRILSVTKDNVALHDLRTLTLDTNCIYALENCETTAAALKWLLSEHSSGRCECALVGISASERQIGGVYLPSFNVFRERTRKLGLGDLQVLRPVCCWGVTYWDCCDWGSQELEAQLRDIHTAMFPSREFSWPNICQAEGVDLKDKSSAAYGRWLNVRCDVLAIQSHIRAGRDWFVTMDIDDMVSQSENLEKLGVGAVLTPNIAAERLGWNG
jgi:hypothetical protein